MAASNDRPSGWLMTSVVLSGLLVGSAISCGSDGVPGGIGGSASTSSDPCESAGGCSTNLCSYDCSVRCCCGTTCNADHDTCGEPDVLWRCDSERDCFEEIACTEGCWSTAHSGPASCFEDMSCNDIAAAYEFEVSLDSCTSASMCIIVDGHCSVGLGGCYHAVREQQVSQADLDRLADAWNAKGCTGPVCDCPPTPTTVDCVEDHCVAM